MALVVVTKQSAVTKAVTVLIIPESLPDLRQSILDKHADVRTPVRTTVHQRYRLKYGGARVRSLSNATADLRSQLVHRCPCYSSSRTFVPANHPF